MEENSWKPFTVRRNGMKISHLCFADDMLLFIEASMTQIENLAQCLDMFCSASGQKVSVAKTRFFFLRMCQLLWQIILADGVGSK